MLEEKLKNLGSRVREARKNCDLTQQELATQTGLAVKTIQDIENGRINPSYETLARLINRLGISANILFRAQISIEEEVMQRFIGKFQLFEEEEQKFLLGVLDFLAEKLLELQR